MNLLDIVPFIAFFGAAILVAELIARLSTRPPHAVQPWGARPRARRGGAHAAGAPAQRSHPDLAGDPKATVVVGLGARARLLPEEPLAGQPSLVARADRP